MGMLTSQKTAESARQWRHNDIQRETETELRASVPSAHVVRNTRHHTRLEHAKQETDTAGLRLGLNDASKDRAESEAESGQRDEPARAHPLAEHSRWNFEHDVGDVEGRQDDVVVVALEVEVFLEAGQSGVAWGELSAVASAAGKSERLTNIGTINKAEQVQQRDSRHNKQIDLQSQLPLRRLIELNKRVPMARSKTLALEASH
jgi:hypothetical protein